MSKKINISELADLLSIEEGREEYRSIVEEGLKEVLYKQKKYGFYSTENLEEIEKEILSLENDD